MPDVETQLAAARTRLILEKPFLGALVLRLPMQAAGDWCKTTATDARGFYYNPGYIRSLNLSQTQFMLAHEALHCALSHFHRRRHRVTRIHKVDEVDPFHDAPVLDVEARNDPYLERHDAISSRAIAAIGSIVPS